MTETIMPDQFVSKLCEPFPAELHREMLLYARIVFQTFAEHAADLRTIGGMRLLDTSDWKEFFQEMGDAIAEVTAKPTVAPLPAPQRMLRDHTCPDCGHEHEGKTECGHYLGEGKFCRCEAKVMA
jgi:hypothetical protein